MKQSEDPAPTLENPFPTSEEKPLGGITRDDNPGDIILEPEEFVTDVDVER